MTEVYVDDIFIPSRVTNFEQCYVFEPARPLDMDIDITRPLLRRVTRSMEGGVAMHSQDALELIEELQDFILVERNKHFKHGIWDDDEVTLYRTYLRALQDALDTVISGVQIPRTFLYDLKTELKLRFGSYVFARGWDIFDPNTWRDIIHTN